LQIVTGKLWHKVKIVTLSLLVGINVVKIGVVIKNVILTPFQFNNLSVEIVEGVDSRNGVVELDKIES
jgi:hypothetical protein